MTNILNQIKTIKNKLFSDKYYLVYKNQDNKIKTYLIGNIDLYKSFGNKKESRDNAGFKAYCFARKQPRSFRHDRIVSITKKWILNFLLEFFLSGGIIYLSYLLYSHKKKQLNAESLNRENLLLKDQLTKKELEFTSRESNLTQTIESLQFSFSKEQDFLKERKLELDSKEKKLLSDILELETKLLEETENRKKVVSQKKSSEVRLGNIAETLAPFLDQFEFDPETCTFLGKPIDYISFGEEEITIIEVKSGKSQLNSRQRQIRDQIKDGLVRWKEIRIQ